jgi:hypothetical protein
VHGVQGDTSDHGRLHLTDMTDAAAAVRRHDPRPPQQHHSYRRPHLRPGTRAMGRRE